MWLSTLAWENKGTFTIELILINWKIQRWKKAVVGMNH